LIDNVDVDEIKRIGLFSYGSGCCSEFYSGIITPESKKVVRAMDIDGMMNNRYELSMEEYDKILDLNMEWFFGVKDRRVDNTPYQNIYDEVLKGKGRLVFVGVENYHRIYDWS
jgi:polyketide biosynthesis 3-hydroxy-3-methylglutaryl-CoA synthase-like enzyme PksG